MKADQLTDILTRQVGARKEGHVFVIPTDSEVTLFVALVGETLTIPRVTRAEIDGPTLSSENARGDRYVVLVEDVRAIKIDRSENVRRDRSAGFGK